MIATMKKALLLITALILLKAAYSALRNQRQQYLADLPDDKIQLNGMDYYTDVRLASSIPSSPPSSNFGDAPPKSPLSAKVGANRGSLPQDMDHAHRMEDQPRHRHAIGDAPPHADTAPAAREEYPRRDTSSRQWAINYFPYTPAGNCKTALTVRSDVALIHQLGFSTIRIHAGDCNALYSVGSACQIYGMRMILGIHIDDLDSTGNSASDEDDESKGPDERAALALAEEQLMELFVWSKSETFPGWDLLEMVVLGEETIHNGFLSPTSMSNLLYTTRTRLRKAGYEGPVTTIEPVTIWFDNRHTLCQVSDLRASNIQPYFSGVITAANAGEYLKEGLTMLDEVCASVPNSNGNGVWRKGSVSLEAGWPSSGRINTLAVPGRLQQEEAIKSIIRHVGDHVAILGFGDDLWKEPGDLGVEASWGCEHILAEQGDLIEEADDKKGSNQVESNMSKSKDHEVVHKKGKNLTEAQKLELRVHPGGKMQPP